MPDDEAKNAKIVVIPDSYALSIQLAEDVRRSAEIVRKRRSEATYDAYAADWAAFERWCRERGINAEAATPRAVATHLTWLADNYRKISTIRRAYAGIADKLRGNGARGWPEKGRPAAIDDALEGAAVRCAELGLFERRVTAITPNLVWQFVEHIGDGVTELEALRDLSMFLTGLYGGFRRSELVAVVTADIATDKARGEFAITVRRSKTSQTGDKPTVKTFERNRDYPELCAVRALSRWLRAAGITRGLIYRPIENGVVIDRRLDPRIVAEIVQRAAKAGNIPGDFAGHSLRAGYVTSAHLAGIDRASAMGQTGHRSHFQFDKYRRLESPFDAGATRGLFGKKREQ
jgi:integrase